MALARDLSSNSDPALSLSPEWERGSGGEGGLLTDLADAAGAGLVRVDTAGNATALNPTGALLLEALGGRDAGPAPLALRDALAAAALDGVPALRDASAQTPESRHISVAALVRGEEQLVALRDHTEERLLQERLLQSEKMASVGQLVSGVAHELNNPLTAVTGFAQILLGRTDLDPVARSHVLKVYEEGERAAKIVQNLLSFARRRRPAKEMTDVNVLVERVLELRSYDFVLRNISLDMTLDRRMARARVDPDQVQQVLFNLVKNAEQAMIDAHGGGRLTVRTGPSPDGRGLRVSIADDGPGIPPEIQRRVFDPFFTTKEAGQGTGLGLTISYSIIDEHGGRIWAENLPGGGAVFTIELPVGQEQGATNREQEISGTEPAIETRGVGAVRPEVLEGREGGAGAGMAPSSGAQLEVPESQGPMVPRTTRRILVVDDEESIRLLLHDALAMDGHAVELAATGIEAMEKLAAGEFDIIISDIKMPGMDGATLYRELHSRDPDLARRLIFITGDTVSPDTRAFLARTSNPVLAKPFKIGALREVIEGVVGVG